MTAPGTDAELVERLRKWSEVLRIPSGSFVNDDISEAADRIESLSLEVERLRGALTAIRDRAPEWRNTSAAAAARAALAHSIKPSEES